MTIAGLIASVLALWTLLPADQSIPVQALVDVTVRDARGRDLETLTDRDFVVTENGAPMTVLGARYVRSKSATPAGAALVGDLRVFGIFLDEYHVTAGPRADAARDALARWVRESLAPGDRVVVLKPLDSLLTIADTDDRESAARAIEAIQPRRGDYAARTTFERNFIAGAPAAIESTRAQVVTSLLHALVTHLGQSAAPRKTLIVLSEALPRANGRRRGEDELPGTDAIVVAANRARVSIYPIDPGDPASRPSAGTANDGDAAALRSHERLVNLAADTNGAVIAAPAAVGDGLAGMLRDATGYYVLTLMPTDWRPAGRLHRITVSVPRPGVAVRARYGYWSPSEAELQPAPAIEAAIRTAPRVLPRRISPLIRPWFGVSRAPDGTTRVDFVWEPAPRVPGDRTPRPWPSRVSLSVSTPEGAPVFTGVVTPSVGVNAGPTSRVSFASTTSRLVVEMAIQDESTRVVDYDVRDLSIGQFRGPVAIGTPEVFRARNAREFTALSDQPDAPPVASRSFSRTERLIFRVPISSTAGEPAITARLFSELGSVMRPLPMSPMRSHPQLFQADLPLASLAAGGYAVEFVVKTTAGTSAERLAFRITP